MIKKYLNNESGWALVMAMVLVIVVPMLAGALYMYSSNSVSTLIALEDIEKANYLARSGADAVMKIYRESDAGSKPTGSCERVYFLTSGLFILESEVEQRDIDEFAVGYVDVDVTEITDTTDPNFGSSRISALAVVNRAKKTYSVLTPAIITGNEAGFYSQSSGYFLTTPDTTSTILRDNEGDVVYKYDTTTPYYLYTHSPESIVICDTSASEFSIPQDTQIGLITEAVFFKDPINIYKTSAQKRITALVLTSKYYIFDGRVTLKSSLWGGDLAEIATLILNTSENSGIEIEGHSGLYSMAYFNEKVVYNNGIWERDIIEAGTSWYIKKRDGGLDIVNWYREDDGAETDYFFQIPEGDVNTIVPTEASLIYFTYE